MNKPSEFILTGMLIFVGGILVHAASAAGLKEPSHEEITKMNEAMPSKPRVQPIKPRKLLIFSISWGYKHSAIPYGRKAFEIMGRKTKAFEPVVSDDLSNFEPGKIEQFDAILFNNTNNEIFLPENFDKLPLDQQEKASAYDALLKKSLVKYLKSGKGLAVTHAGVASFRKWPEYGNIIGARFENHPWNAGSTVTLKVEEPRHPVALAFPTPTFEVTDEIYQVKAPYSRENLRVLVSIDTSKTDMKVKGIRRTDGDFGMTWIKNYGKGRVFYCALGHQHPLFWNPIILQHHLDGIQYVLGDLKADATPSAKLKAN
jgi:type 1 glutamine amidotransferase